MLDMGYNTASVGIGGNGPLIELGSLTEYGPAFKPRAVIWFHFNYHMLRRLRTLKPMDGHGGEPYSVIASRYLIDGFNQSLISRQKEVDKFWLGWSTLYGNNYKRILESDNWRKQILPELNRIRSSVGLREFTDIKDRLNDEDTDREFFLILNTAKRRVESWGGKLYLAIYSSIHSFRGGERRPHDTVIKEVESAGIPAIDIDGAIAATPVSMANFPFFGRPTPFNAGGWAHFNARGYRVFASAIAKKIAADF